MRIQLVQVIIDKLRGKQRRGDMSSGTKRYPLPHDEKIAIIKDIFLSQNCSIFVETGTFKGDTTNEMKAYAQQVYTIELSHIFFMKAVERFKDDPQVSCLEGDSMHVLPEVLKNISSKPLFWLDGHYSAGETACGEKNTPIMEEIAAIHTAALQSFVLLIDDARLFGVSKDYPSFDELGCFIRARWPLADVENKDDIIRVTVRG